MSSDHSPATARPSSTVVLVRDVQNQAQVLMVKRRAQAAYGSNFAFPGGVLDAADAELADRCTGTTPAQANRQLKLERGALAFFVAAVRELFEETGALLATDENGNWAFESDPVQREKLHQAVNTGNLQWQTLLREHELSVPCQHLHYISHWETPTDLPRRYSTRFFVALLPPGMPARHDGAELVDSRWSTAGQLLEEARENRISLPFPTRSTLKLLAAHDTAKAVMAWANQVARQPVNRVRPQAVMVDGERRLLLPGDPGFEEERP